MEAARVVEDVIGRLKESAPPAAVEFVSDCENGDEESYARLVTEFADEVARQDAARRSKITVLASMRGRLDAASAARQAASAVVTGPSALAKAESEARIDAAVASGAFATCATCAAKAADALVTQMRRRRKLLGALKGAFAIDEEQEEEELSFKGGVCSCAGLASLKVGVALTAIRSELDVLDEDQEVTQGRLEAVTQRLALLWTTTKAGMEPLEEYLANEAERSEFVDGFRATLLMVAGRWKKMACDVSLAEKVRGWADQLDTFDSNLGCTIRDAVDDVMEEEEAVVGSPLAALVATARCDLTELERLAALEQDSLSVAAVYAAAALRATTAEKSSTPPLSRETKLCVGDRIEVYARGEWQRYCVLVKLRVGDDATKGGHRVVAMGSGVQDNVPWDRMRRAPAEGWWSCSEARRDRNAKRLFQVAAGLCALAAKGELRGDDDDSTADLICDDDPLHAFSQVFLRGRDGAATTMIAEGDIDLAVARFVVEVESGQMGRVVDLAKLANVAGAHGVAGILSTAVLYKKGHLPDLLFENAIESATAVVARNLVCGEGAVQHHQRGSFSSKNSSKEEAVLEAAAAAREMLLSAERQQQVDFVCRCLGALVEWGETLELAAHLSGMSGSLRRRAASTLLTAWQRREEERGAPLGSNKAPSVVRDSRLRDSEAWNTAMAAVELLASALLFKEEDQEEEDTEGHAWEALEGAHNYLWRRREDKKTAQMTTMLLDISKTRALAELAAAASGNTRKPESSLAFARCWVSLMPTCEKALECALRAATLLEDPVECEREVQLLMDRAVAAWPPPALMLMVRPAAMGIKVDRVMTQPAGFEGKGRNKRRKQPQYNISRRPMTLTEIVAAAEPSVLPPVDQLATFEAVAKNAQSINFHAATIAAVAKRFHKLAAGAAGDARKRGQKNAAVLTKLRSQAKALASYGSTGLADKALEYLWVQAKKKIDDLNPTQTCRRAHTHNNFTTLPVNGHCNCVNDQAKALCAFAEVRAVARDLHRTEFLATIDSAWAAWVHKSGLLVCTLPGSAICSTIAEFQQPNPMPVWAGWPHPGAYLGHLTPPPPPPPSEDDDAAAGVEAVARWVGSFLGLGDRALEERLSAEIVTEGIDADVLSTLTDAEVGEGFAELNGRSLQELTDGGEGSGKELRLAVARARLVRLAKYGEPSDNEELNVDWLTLAARPEAAAAAPTTTTGLQLSPGDRVQVLFDETEWFDGTVQAALPTTGFFATKRHSVKFDPTPKYPAPSDEEIDWPDTENGVRRLVEATPPDDGLKEQDERAAAEALIGCLSWSRALPLLVDLLYGGERTTVVHVLQAASRLLPNGTNAAARHLLAALLAAAKAASHLCGSPEEEAKFSKERRRMFGAALVDLTRDARAYWAPHSEAYRAVVVGDTGAGKSSLLNSFLMEVDVLPTSCMRACTAAIVELGMLRRASLKSAVLEDANMTYSCSIEFCDVASWAAETRPYREWLLSSKRPQPTPAEGSDARLAFDKVRSLFGDFTVGRAYSGGTDCFFFERHPSLGEHLELEACDAEDLRRQSEQYVDSSTTSAQGALWPLVRKVTIRGPWAHLAKNAILVDAPGLRDDNSARDALVRRALGEADALWFVSNIRRATNDKTLQELMSLDFRRRCLSSDGRVGDVLVLATQTDTLNRAEIVENLKLDEATPARLVALQRNAFSRARIDETFYQGVLPEDLPVNREEADGEASSFELCVLCCSAVDCQKLEGRRRHDGAPKVFEAAEETELPALRRLLLAAATDKAAETTEEKTKTGSYFLEALKETEAAKKQQEGEVPGASSSSATPSARAANKKRPSPTTAAEEPALKRARASSSSAATSTLQQQSFLAPLPSPFVRSAPAPSAPTKPSAMTTPSKSSHLRPPSSSASSHPNQTNKPKKKKKKRLKPPKETCAQYLPNAAPTHTSSYSNISSSSISSNNNLANRVASGFAAAAAQLRASPFAASAAATRRPSPPPGSQEVIDLT